MSDHVHVSPSPPAVEDWKWQTDSAEVRTGAAAAAAESLGREDQRGSGDKQHGHNKNLKIN